MKEYTWWGEINKLKGRYNYVINKIISKESDEDKRKQGEGGRDWKRKGCNIKLKGE